MVLPSLTYVSGGAIYLAAVSRFGRASQTAVVPARYRDPQTARSFHDLPQPFHSLPSPCQPSRSYACFLAGIALDDLDLARSGDTAMAEPSRSFSGLPGTYTTTILLRYRCRTSELRLGGGGRAADPNDRASREGERRRAKAAESQRRPAKLGEGERRRAKVGEGGRRRRPRCRQLSACLRASVDETKRGVATDRIDGTAWPTHGPMPIDPMTSS